MSIDDLKTLYYRYCEAWNERNLAALEGFIPSDGGLIHDSAGFLEVRGSPELAKKELEAMSRAFPDFHFTVGDVIAEDDKVVGRWTLTGTHGGEYKGIPATNKKVKMWGIEIFRVVGDKFVEGWVRNDRLDMM